MLSDFQVHVQIDSPTWAEVGFEVSEVDSLIFCMVSVSYFTF